MPKFRSQIDRGDFKVPVDGATRRSASLTMTVSVAASLMQAYGVTLQAQLKRVDGIDRGRRISRATALDLDVCDAAGNETQRSFVSGGRR